jgi:hypothetical protein
MDSLGIDPATLTVDGTLLRAAETHRHAQFPNTPTGVLQLQDWLPAPGVTQVHAWMEATHSY